MRPLCTAGSADLKTTVDRNLYTDSSDIWTPLCLWLVYMPTTRAVWTARIVLSWRVLNGANFVHTFACLLAAVSASSSSLAVQSPPCMKESARPSLVILSKSLRHSRCGHLWRCCRLKTANSVKLIIVRHNVRECNVHLNFNRISSTRHQPRPTLFCTKSAEWNW